MSTLLSEGHLDVLCNTLLNELRKKNIPHNLGREGGPEKAREILRNIYDHFEEQPILQQKFDSNFLDFFDYLLDLSYGLQFDQSNIGKPKFKRKERKKDDERRMLEKVDLFCLIEYLNHNYYEKYFNYLPKFQRDHQDNIPFPIAVDTNGRPINLQISFNENFWLNTFNDYDQYKGTDQKEICIFNKAQHGIASLLHSANQNVHYLSISRLREQENELDYYDPLCTAILFEIEGESSSLIPEKYIVVEGVISNLGEKYDLYKEKIYSELWHKIKLFAAEKKKNIFINSCHSSNQPEPDEFVNFDMKKREGDSNLVGTEQKFYFTRFNEMTGDLVKEGANRGIFQLEKPEYTLKDKGGEKWFTHNFTGSKDNALIDSISNRNGKDQLYKGEQYADTFYLYNKDELPKKENFNSFFELSGYARGFDLSLVTMPQEIKRTETEKSPKAPKKGRQYPLLLGLFTAISSIFLFSSTNERYTGNIFKQFVPDSVPKLEQQLDNILRHECTGRYSDDQIRCMAEDECASRELYGLTELFFPNVGVERCKAGLSLRKVDLIHISSVDAKLASFPLSLFQNPSLHIRSKEGDIYFPFKDDLSAQDAVDLILRLNRGTHLKKKSIDELKLPESITADQLSSPLNPFFTLETIEKADLIPQLDAKLQKYCYSNRGGINKDKEIYCEGQVYTKDGLHDDPLFRLTGVRLDALVSVELQDGNIILHTEEERLVYQRELREYALMGENKFRIAKNTHTLPFDLNLHSDEKKEKAQELVNLFQQYITLREQEKEQILKGQ